MAEEKHSCDFYLSSSGFIVIPSFFKILLASRFAPKNTTILHVGMQPEAENMINVKKFHYVTFNKMSNTGLGDNSTFLNKSNYREK